MTYFRIKDSVKPKTTSAASLLPEDGEHPVERVGEHEQQQARAVQRPRQRLAQLLRRGRQALLPCGRIAL